jgi:hypothetical protein
MGAVSPYLIVCESWEVSPRHGSNEWIAARKRMGRHEPTCASLNYNCVPTHPDRCDCRADGAQGVAR